MVFPKWTNKLPLVLVAGAAFTLCVVSFVVWYWFSPSHLDVGYQPEQPIAFSHQLHAGQLEMDCRYCHFTVDRSPHAGVPPTSTCMNCHSLVLTESPEIKKLTEYHESGMPVPWVRIHKMPDYTYFDHSAHVNKGVSCVECHGRVDQMVEVSQVEPLSMSWCLDCHWNPGGRVRPRDLVTDMGWTPEKDAEIHGMEWIQKYSINPRTDCSTCHR